MDLHKKIAPTSTSVRPSVKFRELQGLPDGVKAAPNRSVYAPLIEAVMALKPGKVLEVDVPNLSPDFRSNVYQAMRLSPSLKGRKIHTRYNFTRDKMYVWSE